MSDLNDHLNITGYYSYRHITSRLHPDRMIFESRGLSDRLYTTDVLEQIADYGADAFVKEDALERAAPEETPVSDGVVRWGDTAVPIEVKAQRLNFEARTEGDWEEIADFLDNTFLHAAKQLDSTVEMIQSGCLADQGLVPDQVRVYLPVVVTLEPAPMQPPLYNLVRSMHDQEELLSGPYTKPLQQLTVEDLEMLEAVARQGHEVRQLLRARVDQGGHQLPFKSWAWQHDRSLAETENERLKAIFEDMVDRALDYLWPDKDREAPPV